MVTKKFYTPYVSILTINNQQNFKETLIKAIPGPDFRCEAAMTALKSVPSTRGFKDTLISSVFP